MRKSNNAVCLTLLAILAIHCGYVSADLPVHCLKKQVLGTWVLKQSAEIPGSSNREQLSCGHHSPDNQDTSNTALGGTLSTIATEVEVTLTEDFQVQNSNGGNVGSWTLVYDEGWEINYQGTKYTHFFKYFKENGEFKSDCSQTLVGWFNHVSMNKRGCSQAFKKDASSADVSSSISLGHVVQPKDEELALSQKSSAKKSIYIQKPSASVFAQMSKLTEKDTLMNHQEVVDRLNKIEGKTWKAGVPKILAQMTLEKMNSHAGIRKSKPRFEFNNKMGSFVETDSVTQTDFAHFSKENVSDLPRDFSWAKNLHPPRSQEDCGSCYAIATSAMLSSRLWIDSGDSTQISPQHSLDCNFYNQGCDGGYGFLVSKYFSEFEAVPESCHPYTAVNGKCSVCNVDQLEHQYIVTDYSYIGGSYGKSSERKMMEEIMKNGPIVASFEPKFDFMYYQSGIYHSVEANTWIMQGESLPSWERVDHSVLCYGWGEDENGKYWLLQNSWGEDWGEKGTFKMRRGTDESNIESMGEKATIKRKVRQSQSRSYVQTTSQSSHKNSNVRRDQHKMH